MRHVLLLLTVALVMAAVAVVVAMPVFAQEMGPANSCETGDTPSSPPDVGGAPASPTPYNPPSALVRQPPLDQSHRHNPFTGPYDRGSCAH